MKSKSFSFLLYIVLPSIAGIFSVWGLILNATLVNRNLAMLDAILSTILLALFATVLANVIRYYRPSNGKEYMLLLWIFTLGLLWFFISNGLLKMIVKNDEVYLNLIKTTSWLRYFMANLVLVCISLVTWIRRQAISDSKQNLRFLATQELAKEAELHSLRQQLQPHFLFNSLNSIYSLIGTEPVKARNMLQQLSEFLRSTLRRDASQMIDTSEEILQTKIYLEIEMVRFPRLEVHWEIEPQCENFKMPVLLLQPLVENAIKFGLYDVRNSVNISIQVFFKNDAINIRISNPFDIESIKSHTGVGFGLENIRRRLYLLYGRKDLIETRTNENIFVVAIQIPQLK